jgi:hypothetical protein
MAFTNGTLYGQYDGQTVGDKTTSAWNGCNTGNPNLTPKNDIFQIVSPGGTCLLQVTSNYVVNTNVAAGSFTNTCELARVQMTTAQYNSLAASPTAAQICAAAFPQNYNNQQLDIFQVATSVVQGTIAGGGGVIFRLTYAGATATS